MKTTSALGPPSVCRRLVRPVDAEEVKAEKETLAAKREFAMGELSQYFDGKQFSAEECLALPEGERLEFIKSKLRVDDFRVPLSSFSLSTSGSKDALLERLLQYLMGE